MCDYCGSDYVPVCECGREYVNTPDELATLRAENDRLRSIVHRAQDHVPDHVWTWHDDAKEALK